jgi:hypothetical protein
MGTKDFEAHETKKLPAKVEFKTKKGEKIKFTARKPTRVSKHVHFKTRDKKRS